MQKALVMAPHFMGYDITIYKTLSKSYRVKLINNEQHMPLIHKEITKSLFKRAIRKLSNKSYYLMYRYLIEKHVNTFLNEIGSGYSLIICINGHYLPMKLLKELKISNPNAKWILYLWDDVANLLHRNHFTFFNDIFSYNLDDCKNYRFKFLSMFVQYKPNISQYRKIYDFAIIGTAHPDRVKVVERILDKYKNNYNIYIYLFRPNKISNGYFYDKPLSFKNYIEILLQSKIVFDIPYVMQKGPTTRFQDAMLTKTKVITTNKYIKKYPFFSDNILVIDRQNPNITTEFINKEYVNDNQVPIMIEEWVEKLLYS